MKNRWRIVLALLILASLLGWRAIKDLSENMAENNKTLEDLIWDFSLVSAAPQPLVDNQALYGDGSQDDVVLPLFVIVLPTQNDDGDAVTFTDLNAIKDYRVEKPLLHAYFADNSSEASANVRELAERLPLGNALITLRGHSTLSSEKKSYKIKLNAETTAWRGQMTLNLNKHPNDESRLRNKIAFDLIRLIPDLTSMQTRFVNLYVKDLTEGPDGGFVDYGLFTQIEQGNELFLKNHGLDENGNLYKANYFEFLRYPDHLKNIDDPGYDPALFEENLGICAGTNHEKLIKMIDDVNNQALDIDLVLNKHFNRDNYFSWLALNILLGNFDTQTQNYYLYSPHDALTWYFLPWDYDGSMVYRTMTDVDGELAQLVGVANYWGNVLHARVFRKEHNLAELSAKVDSIYQILSNGDMDEIIDQYQPLIEKYYLNNPAFSKEFTVDEFYDNIETIRSIVSHNRNLYYASIDKPMPIFLGEIEMTEDGARFFWSESCDLQGDRISYTLQVSCTLDFSDLVFVKSRITSTSFTVELEPGVYYWRIIVSDNKGETQRAFDVFWESDTDKNIHTGIYGIKKITIGE